MSSSGESDISDDDSDFSGSDILPWQDEINEDGELFYIEESRSEMVDDIQLDRPRKKQSVIIDQSAQNGRMEMPSSGEVLTKTVFVSVEPPASYSAESSSLLVEMLGIIMLNTGTGDSLIVNALAPNSPAYKTEEISLGDELIAINNVAVSRTNIEQVLSRIPYKMELRLTLICTDKRKTPTSNVTSLADSPRIVSGTPQSSSLGGPEQLTDSCQAVFYLTMNVDSETAKGEEDIIYMYPKESAEIRKFKSIRGIFTTLTDVSADAFSCEIHSSTMLINDVTHCSYCRDGTEVLVLCQPTSVNILPLQHYMVSCVARLLRIMYGSLTKAFEEKNRPRVDQLFQRLFTTAPSYTSALGLAVGGCEALSLADNDIADIDISMTEFEASDFDDGTRESSQRAFSILGTCLYYKGFLAVSHLDIENLRNMHEFCQVFGLLDSTQSGRIIVWREVYIQNKKAAESLFKKSNGRHFYLIIGLHGSLLCVLLESGGYSSLEEKNPAPPPLYINHATSVILHLESLGVMEHLEKQLTKPSTASQVESLTGKLSGVFSSSGPSQMPNSPQKEQTRSSGAFQPIFHSLHFDAFSGMLITTDKEIGASGKSNVSLDQILENFYKTALVFHNRWISHLQKEPKQSILEEGTMFMCPAEKNSTPLRFWVVGRCLTMPSTKEYFVCYHDSVRQDVTELAFRMGFGTAA